MLQHYWASLFNGKYCLKVNVLSISSTNMIKFECWILNFDYWIFVLIWFDCLLHTAAGASCLPTAIQYLLLFFRLMSWASHLLIWLWQKLNICFDFLLVQNKLWKWRHFSLFWAVEPNKECKCKQIQYPTFKHCNDCIGWLLQN